MPAWWLEERIDATVNRDYVWRELGSIKHQEKLHRPLAFGHSLTNDTYIDWILLKARRLFLILDHIGLPESIFQVLDRSLDDDDLPLSEEALYELNLFGGKSETVDKKFYRQQFQFLAKDLASGQHTDYDTHDVVPLEVVHKRPSVSSNSTTDKISLHDRLYTRKRLLTSGERGVDRVHFVIHMKALQKLRHPHLVEVFASYTQDDFSYMLLTPSSEISLKTFLEEQPKSFKQLEKAERRATLLRWTHCTTSALAYLHSKGFTHQSIRPSSILVSIQNTICLSDFWALKALDDDETSNSYKAETYDHAAPENWQRKACLHETGPLKTTLPGGGRTTRRLPSVSAAAAPTSRSGSFSATAGSQTRRRSKTESSSSSCHSQSRNAIITTFATPSLIGSPSFAADVFSLSTILLELMTLLLGRTMKAFSSHRSKHNRLAGRGGAPADASFHKNLPQVGTWIESLHGQAKDKERSFSKTKLKGKAESLFYGAVVGVVGVCKNGVWRDPSDRLTASEFEKGIRQWVDRGLGTGRRWCCGAEAEEVIPGMSPASVAGADMRGKRRERSVRTESPASFDIQLPIERPISEIPTENSSVATRIGEDFGSDASPDAHDMYLPDEDDDWPLRRESSRRTEGNRSTARPGHDERKTRSQARPMGGFYALDSYYSHS
ncbi:MAG: hypothetical protein HETSPECPRED_004830 [Heterodermia speciosa]|uniref:Protein kinase domain-containing protein n=1 Tax=Heterodermia speciosa TaxID=116794 RepID=A0A8H3I504_9LECA|nr:MAG: hypothetical protein HETSPECPRED_004830 [Heterodermia speciosa]